MRRIGVHHTNPFQTISLSQLPNQTCQSVLFAQILAVTRRILCNQNQLLDPFLCQLMSLGNDGTKPAAAEVSTHLRNETERARPVAAFGDLYECIVRRRSKNTRRRFVVEISRCLIA